jgi:hypothetical protein
LKKRASKLVQVGPFYSIYGLGDFKSPYKVVCAAMGTKESGNIRFVVVSSINDKFLGKKLVLAECTLTFIPSNIADEAHYICAVLNSKLMSKTITSSFSTGKTRFGQNFAQNIRLDRYNPKNKIHTLLSDLSKEAHLLASKEDTEKLSKVEEKIEKIVEDMYNLAHTIKSDSSMKNN